MYEIIDYRINLFSDNADDVLNLDRRRIRSTYYKNVEDLLSYEIEQMCKDIVDSILGQEYKEEGIENMNARHRRHSLALRNAIRAIGLELVVKEDKNASNSITSILPPDGISVPDIRKVIKEDFDIVVANGQNELKDKIFRMGTLGFVCDRDLISAVGALEATLYKLGYKFELGKGVATVIKELAK